MSATEFETVASHLVNNKKLSLALSHVDSAILAQSESINFTCKVRGVAPNCADKYRVTFKLLLNDQIVGEVSSGDETL